MKTRAEHLAWCKERALEYLKPGEFYSVQEAVTSMLSDLSKHEETKGAGEITAPIAMFDGSTKDPRKAERFITGFN